MRDYLFIFKKHKNFLAILFILSIMSSLMGILSTYISGMYIDLVIEATSFHSILWISIAVFATIVLNLILDFIITYMKNPLGERLVFEFKSHILSHLRKVSLMEYKKFNIAYLSKRIDEDSKQISMFFIENYSSIIIRGVELIIISALILRINFLVGSLMILLFPIYYYMYIKFKDPIFKKSLELKEKSAKFFQDYTYQLDDNEDIIIESSLDKEEEVIQEKFSSYYKTYKGFVLTRSQMGIAQGLIIGVMQVIIFFVGGIDVLRGVTTIGLLSILMVYFMQVLTNITYYVELAKQFQITTSSIHRLNEIFLMEKIKEGNKVLKDINKISANINYSIDGKKILSDILINSEKGEITAILGKNGAGKTTLLKLLVGALKHEEKENSSILLNDQYNIQDIDSVHFRKEHLSYVPQKIKFRDLTVKEVINENDQIKTVKQLIEKLKIKNVSLSNAMIEFISKNWDKKINDLSGGDKQFISILKGITKKINIFILDEPTSNLDETRIEWLKSILNQIKRDSIVFIITHDVKLESIFDKKIELS